MGYSTIGTMESVVTDDVKTCICPDCGRKADDCHHVFEGKNKHLSEKYKLMVPLCHEHHMELHDNQEMNLYFKRMAQRAFEEKIGTKKQFITIFGRNYL